MDSSEALPDLRARLEACEREEEWALVGVLAWLVLLLFIVVVVLFSPVPWGALIGLAVWAWAAWGVFKDFSAAVRRTRDVRDQIERLERSDGAGE